MLTFTIPTGQLRIDGMLVGIGYSGHTDAANDATRTTEHNKGPICPGKYKIRKATAAEIAQYKKGPSFFWLDPDPSNDMAGRSGFLIHWDSTSGDFTGSDGCIVFWIFVVFQRIAAAVAAGNDILLVIGIEKSVDGISKVVT